MNENTDLLPEEQAQSASEKPKTAYRVELCFAWAVLLAAAALFVLTGSSGAFLPAVIGCIWALTTGLKMKRSADESVQENIKRIIICILITAFSQLFAPFHVGALGAWRYPIVKGYVKLYNTTRVPEWLPDRIPDGAEDYRLDYMPSIMQGSGHFSVRFKCGGEELERWVSFGESKARYIFRLADYAAASGYSWDDEETSAGTEKGLPELGDFDVIYDKGFWQGCEDGADVYIISANIDRNHPHAEAVIINKESGMVEFTAQ